MSTEQKQQNDFSTNWQFPSVHYPYKDFQIVFNLCGKFKSGRDKYDAVVFMKNRSCSDLSPENIVAKHTAMKFNSKRTGKDYYVISVNPLK